MHHAQGCSIVTEGVLWEVQHTKGDLFPLLESFHFLMVRQEVVDTTNRDLEVLQVQLFYS